MYKRQLQSGAESVGRKRGDCGEELTGLLRHIVAESGNGAALKELSSQRCGGGKVSVENRIMIAGAFSLHAAELKLR